MTEIVKYQNALTKFQPTTLDEIIRLAGLFADSGLFNVDNARQSAAQLAVKIMAGQELGFTPFAAANGMQIIKGKCAPGANLMAALVKASGRYNYRVTEMTDTKVSIDFFENGKPIGTSTFTAQDAAKATTQNMNKFPRNMLFARAISNGVKWYCPDISNGVAMYTPEELGATVDYETGEIITSGEITPTRNPEPNAPSDDENRANQIIAAWTKPKDAMDWAVSGNYTANEFSARNRFKTIIDTDFAGKCTTGNQPDVFRAYATHYLNKQKETVLEAA